MNTLPKIPTRIAALIVEYSNIILLILTVFIVFIIPILPVDNHRQFYSIFYSILFFNSMLVLKSKRKVLVIAALIAFVTEWIAELNHASGIMFVSRLSNVLFFVIIVIKMIVQIARYQQVNLVVIVEAITGYLLMGLMFSVLVVMTMAAEPGAYSFGSYDTVTIADINYYTFITLSTLGYGDFLPLMPVSKSLAIFITISGQLYLAIIIATLVGKFLTQDSASKETEI